MSAKNFGHHWRYKNILIGVAGVVLAFILSRSHQLSDFFQSTSSLGPLSAFLGGLLLVFTFTFSTGVLAIITLGKIMSPLEVAVLATLGAVVGNLFTFLFVKEELNGEVNHLIIPFEKKHHLYHVFHSRYFHWTLPLIGALIIMTPLPDELGVSLLGISKMKTLKFILVTFILHFVGMLTLLGISIFL